MSESASASVMLRLAPKCTSAVQQSMPAALDGIQSLSHKADLHCKGLTAIQAFFCGILGYILIVQPYVVPRRSSLHVVQQKSTGTHSEHPERFAT